MSRLMSWLVASIFLYSVGSPITRAAFRICSAKDQTRSIININIKPTRRAHSHLGGYRNSRWRFGLLGRRERGARKNPSQTSRSPSTGSRQLENAEKCKWCVRSKATHAQRGMSWSTTWGGGGQLEPLTEALAGWANNACCCL